MKLDNSGNFLWAKGIGGAGNDQANALLTDPAGNMYVAGKFEATVDFDPGSGASNLTALGGADSYIAKFDSSGNLIRVKAMGGSLDEQIFSMTFDAQFNIYATGNFYGTCDFDPGLSVYNLTSAGSTDVFICKLDSAGNFIWAKLQGGSGTSNSDAIVVYSNFIYLCGSYSGSADFDPSAGTQFLNSSSGNLDLYVCKLDTSGTFIWVRSSAGPSSDVGSTLTVDSLGYIYMFGSFSGAITFPMGSVFPGLTSMGSTDSYICKLDSLGTYIWIDQVGGTGIDRIGDVFTDNHFNIYLTGYFSGTTDSDPTSGTANLISGGGNDAYFVKMKQDMCSDMSVTIDTCENVLCLDTGLISVTAHFGIPPYTYTWTTNPTVTDSVLHPLTPGLYNLTTTDAIGCAKNNAVLVNGSSAGTFQDLEVNMLLGAFRPGFSDHINIDAYNRGCDTVSGTLTIILDTLLHAQNAFPAPDSISGDTLFWNFSGFNYDYGHIMPDILFFTPTYAQIGDIVCITAYIKPFQGDIDTLNNYRQYCIPVVNGYDPNDKRVYPTGDCSQHYVLNNQPLTYTIRFQNTGNSSAININVIDTLDSDLDVSSLVVVGNSHPMITEIQSGNTIIFHFNNINLPDSGSNEVASHGYVIYQINPNSGSTAGTIVKNKAEIYFDFNSPIVTNSTLNTLVSAIPSCSSPTAIEDSHGISEELIVYPNPADEYIYINNISSNSIVRLYDLYGRLLVVQNPTTDKWKISINVLPSGSYLLEVLGESRLSTFRHIIISR